MGAIRWWPRWFTPPEYNARPALTCACYAYWRDVTPHVPAIHPRARRVVISFSTNDGLTVTPPVFPRDELPAVRASLGLSWALVGDAGYHKDPILAQGISDAFRSSEWVADAVHAGFSGARALDEAMAEYQRVRDEHFAPKYDLTCGMAGPRIPAT